MGYIFLLPQFLIQVFTIVVALVIFDRFFKRKQKEVFRRLHGSARNTSFL
ncbi:hypothetical protein PAECIP111892_03705 [Paenibacillus auburnensis]|uniref:Uncharacterized protein n=1 Tax=Paenibacillus auburnensis TaxID=2905649 RepID=A0ABN8GLJ1_9BACL|nr:hypothetical protein [Paenibacillus auburnensis]CAH1212157.1 hypothetical protein PAECIP111892_03705 [Paenibacillus auburnensis]